MSWQADPRALREFGRFLAMPKVRKSMKLYNLDTRPVLCVDERDSALDVLTEASLRGTSSVILIRVAEGTFRILAQVYGAEHVPIEIPEDMTIGEYNTALIEHHEPSKFANAGALTA